MLILAAAFLTSSMIMMYRAGAIGGFNRGHEQGVADGMTQQRNFDAGLIEQIRQEAFADGQNNPKRRKDGTFVGKV